MNAHLTPHGAVWFRGATAETVLHLGQLSAFPTTAVWTRAQAIRADTEAIATGQPWRVCPVFEALWPEPRLDQWFDGEHTWVRGPTRFHVIRVGATNRCLMRTRDDGDERADRAFALLWDRT